MRVKIYQIEDEKDTQNVKFRSFDETSRHGGVDASTYRCVYAGDIRARHLDDIFHALNQDEKPPTYQGHSLSTSDVVEVFGDIPEVYGCIDYFGSNGEIGEKYYLLTKEEYDRAIAEDEYCGRPHEGHIFEGQHVTLAEKGFFFCDDFGWKKIDFDPTQAESMKGLRVLLLQPHEKPIETRVIDDLAHWQNAVSDHGEESLMEITYPFDDGVVVVGNEEAKLIGMEGNRHIGDAVYAGPLYLVADQNGDLRSLTDEQILTYGKMFEEPEDISPEEVEADTGFYIY